MMHGSTTAPCPPAATRGAEEPRPTVALIDDDSAVRESLRRVLVSEGFRVAAATAAEARRVVELFSPELIITDLPRPATDDLDFLFRQLRSHTGVPLFIITALPARECHGLDHIADEFFRKPIDLDALVAALHRHLRNRATTGSHS